MTTEPRFANYSSMYPLKQITLRETEGEHVGREISLADLIERSVNDTMGDDPNPIVVHEWLEQALVHGRVGTGGGAGGYFEWTVTSRPTDEDLRAHGMSVVDGDLHLLAGDGRTVVITSDDHRILVDVQDGAVLALQDGSGMEPGTLDLSTLWTLRFDQAALAAVTDDGVADIAQVPHSRDVERYRWSASLDESAQATPRP